ncbi:MAG: hypothetical protein ACK58J_24595, partial [Planctomyces sp.]
TESNGAENHADEQQQVQRFHDERAFGGGGTQNETFPQSDAAECSQNFSGVSTNVAAVGCLCCRDN